jgi:hypothetical protein
MPNAVVECRADTIDVIRQVSGCDPGKLPDPSTSPSADPTDDRYRASLRLDLLLAPAQIRSFAEPFSQIARKFTPTAKSISGDACQALDTVADACTLVTRTAGL